MNQFVLYESYTLVRQPPDTPAVYSLEAAATLAGVHPDLLRYYCQHNMFGPARAQAGHNPTFDDDAVYELRRIEDYRRHHGVNRQALPLLWELSREVERLQTELRFLRGP